jgi:cytochrome c oxidase assembly factor CtaG
MSVTAPLTWRTAVTMWQFPPAAAALLLAAAALYGWGVARVPGWPRRNLAAFLAGLAVTALAVGGSINAYSDVLFVMHMVQHLLLIMVAPILLVLGRPAGLARRAVTGRAREALRRAGRARVVAFATNPLVVFGCYAAVVVGTHLTPFQQAALTVAGLHPLEELLYLASGYLLVLLVLGDGPLPRRFPYLMRVVLLLVAMVVDTVVGVALLMTNHEPFPAYAATGRTWGPTPVEDLHWGGALMWVGGDALMVALSLIVVAAWINSGQGSDLGPWLEAARRSALAGPGADHAGASGLDADRDLDGDLDDDEEALRAYNAMLARLAGTEQDRPRGRSEPPPS